MHCSIIGGTATTASVTGSQGRIDIPHGFFHPDRFVLHRDGRDPEEFTADPADGPARQPRHEAAEVMRALRAGETESPLVPLDGTLAVMRTLDAIRDRVGVRYPGEDPRSRTRRPRSRLREPRLPHLASRRTRPW